MPLPVATDHAMHSSDSFTR